MKEVVMIKSFPNGISLYLDAELPFEKILEEIGYKFAQARNFFGNVAMALSIEEDLLPMWTKSKYWKQSVKIVIYESSVSFRRMKPPISIM